MTLIYVAIGNTNEKSILIPCLKVKRLKQISFYMSTRVPSLRFANALETYLS